MKELSKRTEEGELAKRSFDGKTWTWRLRSRSQGLQETGRIFVFSSMCLLTVSVMARVLISVVTSCDGRRSEACEFVVSGGGEKESS